MNEIENTYEMIGELLDVFKDSYRAQEKAWNILQDCYENLVDLEMEL